MEGVYGGAVPADGQADRWACRQMDRPLPVCFSHGLGLTLDTFVCLLVSCSVPTPECPPQEAGTVSALVTAMPRLITVLGIRQDSVPI